MNDTYQGPVEIDLDDRTITVDADLYATAREWGGRLEIDYANGSKIYDAARPGTVTVRLPDGREGAVSGKNKPPREGGAMPVKGTGVPPWRKRI